MKKTTAILMMIFSSILTGALVHNQDNASKTSEMENVRQLAFCNGSQISMSDPLYESPGACYQRLFAK